MNVENTNPTPCVSEIFEVAARPFAAETVGQTEKASQVTYIAEPTHIEKIKPSLEFSKQEFYYKTIELTGCRRANATSSVWFSPELSL